MMFGTDYVKTDNVEGVSECFPRSLSSTSLKTKMFIYRAVVKLYFKIAFSNIIITSHFFSLLYLTFFL